MDKITYGENWRYDKRKVEGAYCTALLASFASHGRLIDG